MAREINIEEADITIIEWLAAQQGGEVIVQGTKKATEFLKKWLIDEAPQKQ